MEANDDTDEARQYWSYRRATMRALAALALSSLIAMVFHEPAAWGDGQVASLVRGGSLVAAAVAAVLAFRWNAETAERSGYFRGAHGGPPPPAE